MSATFLRVLARFGGAILLLLPVPAEAQIGRRFAGRRVIAPLARVQVGPYGGVSIRAPLVAIDVPGRIILGRRRALFAQDMGHAPAPTETAQPQAAGRQPQPTFARSVEAPAFPTTEELAALDDAALLDVLRNVESQLTERLGRLDTGSGWQRHLAIDVDAMGESLRRFDKVSANPGYAKIWRLPSFVATQQALRERVSRYDRYDGPKLTADAEVQPAAAQREEALPTPVPVAEPSLTPGERSILKRR